MKLVSTRVVVAEIHPGNDGKVAEWVLLFKAGWNEVEDGPRYLVDEASFRLVEAGFKRRGLDVVFDYEHQTLSGDKAPAAGWIKEIRWDAVIGIQARVVWTEEAAGFIAKGEYRYFSPVFYVRQSDQRLVGFHSCALTNTPRHNHLTPILAKLGSAYISKEDDMDLLKKLIAALKLGDGTTEADVVAAVAKMSPAPAIPADVLGALGLQEGDASTVVASIHALKQGAANGVPRAEFEALKSELAKRDATEVVAKALSEGKITPDQRAWAEEYAARDLPGFKVFAAKAPVVVPVGKLPGKGDPGGQGQELEETVLAVAKQMGVTAEDIKTYGGKTNG